MNGTFVSLFAGIGGLDLALEALGYRCTAQVEWDRHCSRILERHWPDVSRWGDVHEFTAAAYAEGQQAVAAVEGGLHPEPPSEDRGVDLICGGFPCQPVSTAGRRKAGSDERWLWPEFARVVGELRPRAVLIENVRGLLSAGHVDPATGEPVRGSAFGEVLGDLADLGYDATWTVFRASDVGACHQRARVFILAHADGGDGWGRAEAGRVPTPAGAGDEAPRDADDGGHGAGLTGAEAEGAPGPEPGGAGRGRASADTEDVGRQRTGDVGATSESGRCSTASGEAGPFPWGAYEPAIRRWEAMTRPAPHPVDDRGRLAPPFVEWMMGFPAGWTETMTRTQALKALGNAVVPHQAVAAFLTLQRMAEIEGAA